MSRRKITSKLQPGAIGNCPGAGGSLLQSNEIAGVKSKEVVDALEVAIEDYAARMNQSQTRASQSGAKGGPVVFVVDDEPLVGDVVQAILRMGGYSPVFFEDPRDALKTFTEINPKPDLLLTDFQMPKMTGRELIQKCKQVQPSLKTILYSGNVQEDTVAMYPIRPDRFLRKPFTPKTLIELVKSVLAERTPQTNR
jgi:CheY-like chemotaxis protein